MLFCSASLGEPRVTNGSDDSGDLSLRDACLGKPRACAKDLSPHAMLIADAKAAVDKECKEVIKRHTQQQGKLIFATLIDIHHFRSTSTSRGMYARAISSVGKLFCASWTCISTKIFGVLHPRSCEYCVCDGRCTHTLLSHAHFSALRCAHPHIFMRVNTHAWPKVVKRVCCIRMSLISISPSPFSCFTLHPCCSLTVTSRPPSRLWRPRLPCRTLPDPEARVKRTSAWVPRSLATWPVPRTPQKRYERRKTNGILHSRGIHEWTSDGWTLWRDKTTTGTFTEPDGKGTRTHYSGSIWKVLKTSDWHSGKLDPMLLSFMTPYQPTVKKKWCIPKLKKFHYKRFTYRRVCHQKLSSRVLGEFDTQIMINV